MCRDTTGTAPRDAAIAVSRLLKGVPVVLLVKDGGRAVASRWMDGEQGEDLKAGLVMNGAPDLLEDLLLGCHGRGRRAGHGVERGPVAVPGDADARRVGPREPHVNSAP